MTDENRQQLGKVYDDFMSYVEDNRAKPFLLTKVEDGAVFDFTFLPVTQYEGLMNVTQADSFSALLAAFFEKKGKAERMQRRTATAQNGHECPRPRGPQVGGAEKGTRGYAQP